MSVYYVIKRVNVGRFLFASVPACSSSKSKYFLQGPHQSLGIGSGTSSSESVCDLTEDTELVPLERDRDLELEEDVDELEELHGIRWRCLDHRLAAIETAGDFLI